jgi:hypothetical protein
MRDPVELPSVRHALENMSAKIFEYIPISFEHGVLRVRRKYHIPTHLGRAFIIRFGKRGSLNVGFASSYVVFR